MSTVQVRNLGKRFGSLVALDGITVEFKLGELCGLAGHNGAGKSTLFNILSGAFPPDQGEIEVGGKLYRPRNYRDAMNSGVFRVSQELTLFENLTVFENASFGLEKYYTTGGFLRSRLIRKDLSEFLLVIGLDHLPLDARVDNLSLAQKQLTEIARCLFSAFKSGISEPILLFDEPTSGLIHSQARFIGRKLQRLASEAFIILTSHRGNELLDYPSRVVVMRDGQIVADRLPDELNIRSLEELMTGTAKNKDTPQRERSGTRTRAQKVPALEIGGSIETAGGRIVVHEGEIVGVAGGGEHKSQLLAGTAGWGRRSHVDVKIKGGATGSSAYSRARAGLRYVPGERAREGFSIGQPVTWNVTLPSLARGSAYRRFARKPRDEIRFVTDLIDKFSIRVSEVTGAVAQLSGGNQQRLLVARALDQDALVLLCDRPTRGVDVTARAEVHAAIKNAAARGIACLVASDEPEELAVLCDRVVILRPGGEFTTEINTTGSADADADRILDEIES